MLSRTADNLFWLSRYVERADYLARILETTSRLSVLPVAYAGDGNEVAEMCLFLASERGKWITGQAIDIDGGTAWQ